jgi:hypothetical protein
MGSEGEVIMLSRRVLGAIGCLLATVGHCWAQSATLVEPVVAGECYQIKLDMKLTGEMRGLNQDGAPPLKMEAAGTHEVRERIMAVGVTGLPEKSARIYDRAEAVIVVNKDRIEKNLRPDRKLIVAQRQRDGLLAYCPTGALTQNEMDLTTDHFDILGVVGLLPGKAVSVGDTWKISNTAAQAVCSFDGLTEHTLAGKLESVKDDVATFSVAGTANGIDMGAMVKLSVEARGQFDLKSKRLVELEWNQKDQRDGGPISPATNVQARTVMKRTLIEQPNDLSDAALVSIPDKVPTASMTNLEYHDLKGRFDLLYGREWQITSQSESRLVMRLMERGDFIAQVTITPWSNAGKGKHMTPEEFRTRMNDTPGWELEKELQAGDVPGQGEGRWIHRVSLLGTLDGVNVLQNFYLVAGPEGDQVVVAFSMTPKQADKLGARDLSLVTSMEVPSPKK